MKHPVVLYLRKHGLIRSVNQVKEVTSEVATLPIDCVLAQGFAYLSKYYISLLEEYKEDPNCFEFAKSVYWKRLLERGFDKDTAKCRIINFLHLYRKIEDEGFLYLEDKPVAVCDVGDLLPYRYYRYDGAQRTCIAKVLGLKEILVLLTTLKFRNPK